MSSRMFEVEVTDATMLSEHVRGLTVRRAGGGVLRALPGQFFMMHFEHEGTKLNRSYSVANIPSESGELDEVELAIALVDGGIGSAIIRDVEPGDRLRFSGPHGRFVLRDSDPEHTVLIGTGTGVAPFRSMRRQLVERLRGGDSVDLLSGCRCEEHFLYDGEWRQLESEYAKFHYHACASAPSDAEAHRGAGGLVGRVQRAFETLNISPGGAVFYLCGNEYMVRDMRSLLTDAGFGRRSIRTEAYVSPPSPDELT